MNIIQLHTLTQEQIQDLLGLMKELNPEIEVTAEMLEAVVADPGARFFAAIGPDGHFHQYFQVAEDCSSNSFIYFFASFMKLAAIIRIIMPIGKAAIMDTD